MTFRRQICFASIITPWRGPFFSKIFHIHCTLIRGGIVIQPGLNINYSLHHSAFWSYFLSVVQISSIADFSSMHSGEFCPFLQISTFACLFPCYLWSIWISFFLLVKLTIIDVFCKITCRIWTLKHRMNQAILFLVFFSYIFIYCTKPQNWIYRKGWGRSDLDQQKKKKKMQL